jgi:hypothetical protein
VNVERGEQRPACTARVVQGDATDAVPGAPDIEGRFMLRGSIGWPVLVVKTSVCFSPQIQMRGQVSARTWP